MGLAAHLGRALVTGASGFLASHLVPALEALGAEPVLLSRKRPASGSNWIACALDDVDELAALMHSHCDGVVFHLAGSLCRGECGARFAGCVEANLLTAMHVLQAALAAGMSRVVLLGSAEEYGAQPGQHTEDMVVNPASPYGIVRAATTRMALAIHEQTGCPAVVLRLYSVYGPRQPAEMFVAEAVQCAVEGRDFEMSSGEQRRDLIYVADVVDALIAASTAAGVKGKVLNIGSGQPRALREVAETVWRLSGTRATLRIGARAASEAQRIDTWANTSRARELLGWSPKTDLETGLAATIEAAESRKAGAA